MGLSLNQKTKESRTCQMRVESPDFDFIKSHIFFNLPVNIFFYDGILYLTTAKSVCSVLPRSNSLIVKCLTYFISWGK